MSTNRSVMDGNAKNEAKNMLTENIRLVNRKSLLYQKLIFVKL